MPIIESAIKRARQNLVRRERRLPVKSYLKTMLRKFGDLVKEKKVAEAQKLMPEVFSAIDMAAKKRVIHHRNASRKKSLVSRLVSAK